MIQKSLLSIGAMVFMVIVLAACGKGVDRKLDYSGTEKELGESYDEAIKDATPEQQNILRERMGAIITIGPLLVANSNPATVEANEAKRNAEEFKRIRAMSVRELLIDTLSKRQAHLNSIIPELDKIENGDALKVVGIEIKDINPKDLTNKTDFIDISGVISIRNDSDSFIYDFRECQLAIVLDGKQLNDFSWCSQYNSVKQADIKNKGGTASFDFVHRLKGDENIKTVYDLLKSGQMAKIAWNFKQSDRSYIKSSDGSMAFNVGGSDLKNYKEELQKIMADLAVLKK